MVNSLIFDFRRRIHRCSPVNLSPARKIFTGKKFPDVEVFHRWKVSPVKIKKKFVDMNAGEMVLAGKNSHRWKKNKIRRHERRWDDARR